MSDTKPNEFASEVIPISDYDCDPALRGLDHVSQQEKDVSLLLVKKHAPEKLKPKPIEHSNNNKSKNGWYEKYMPKAEQIAEFADPKWIVPNMIIEGHMTVICAKPNGGKTTIMMELAGQMAETNDVLYINADLSATDAKWQYEFATSHGFKLLLPDLQPGLSMSSVVADLVELANGSDDLHGQVYIFDTLKTMVDVINKRESKALYSVLRGLTMRGATLVVLAHTNKYDVDDKPVYEGTNDLASQFDNMIYLISEKHDDRSMTVSTLPDKVRGAFDSITFEIDPDRNVTLLSEYVDVAGKQAVAKQLDDDATVIERVTEAIQAEKFKQSHIVEYCKEHCLSRRQVEPVLTRYEGKLWVKERLSQNNAFAYHLK